MSSIILQVFKLLSILSIWQHNLSKFPSNTSLVDTWLKSFLTAPKTEEKFIEIQGDNLVVPKGAVFFFFGLCAYLFLILFFVLG